MSKQETDSLHETSVSFLKKHGYFKGWRCGTIEWTHGWSENKSNVAIEVSTIGDFRKYYRGEPSGNSYIRFNYTQTDRFTEEKNKFDYKIPLTTTPCYFGGKRYWFICPWYSNGVYCGRRVGALYLGCKYFACRHCYDLTYSSRNLSGISKIAGQVISFPELEKLESEIKRKYYAGKMTRRYKRYLRKQEKADRQLMVMARHFGSDNIYDAVYKT